MRQRRRVGIYLSVMAGVIGLVVAVAVLGPSFWRVIYPLPYRAVIEKHALANDLDPYLVAAIIRVESGFRPTATSPRDARGLMQILPSTGAWIASQIGLADYHESRLYEPEYNIMMGCWYLRNLKVQFEGHLTVALAAYNGGRGNVANWLTKGIWSGDTMDIGKIPFPETRGYVWKVLRTYAVYTELYAPRSP